jgi:hypothetical protein
MKKLIDFFKQVRLSRILTVFLATVVLFSSTACNSGDIRGARPDNPPVQAGGANNPYKSGGDTNTNFNISPDPKVNNKSAKADGKRADLQIISNQLIASNEDGRLYKSGQSPSISEVEKSLPIKTLKDFETPEPGGEIQRDDNIGDRIQDRLSTVKETFDKASGFINGGAGEALDRHEAAPTPGLD